LLAEQTHIGIWKKKYQNQDVYFWFYYQQQK